MCARVWRNNSKHRPLLSSTTTECKLDDFVTTVVEYNMYVLHGYSGVTLENDAITSRIEVRTVSSYVSVPCDHTGMYVSSTPPSRYSSTHTLTSSVLTSMYE